MTNDYSKQTGRSSANANVNDEETVFEEGGNAEGRVRRNIVKPKGNSNVKETVIGAVAGAAVGIGGTILGSELYAQDNEVEENLENQDPVQPDEQDMSFDEAFAQARAQMGPGQVFEWHGNRYTTDYQEEVNAQENEEVVAEAEEGAEVSQQEDVQGDVELVPEEEDVEENAEVSQPEDVQEDVEVLSEEEADAEEDSDMIADPQAGAEENEEVVADEGEHVDVIAGTEENAEVSQPEDVQETVEENAEVEAGAAEEPVAGPVEEPVSEPEIEIVPVPDEPDVAAAEPYEPDADYTNDAVI